MVDSRATMTIMHVKVMDLGLKVDIPSKKSYAKDNRLVPIVAMIKKC